jgi:hypothetical protein
VKRNFRDAVLTFLITGLPMGLLLAHLLSRKWSFGFFGWVAVVAAIGLIVLEIIWLVRAWSVSRNMSDPRVLVKPAPLKLGQPFGFRMELDAYSPMRVTKVEAKLACVEHYRERQGNKTHTGTRDKGTKVLELPGGEVAAGGMLEREGEWSVGHDEWPASGNSTQGYPYYTWEVRLNVVVDGAADYSGVFPLDAA